MILKSSRSRLVTAAIVSLVVMGFYGPGLRDASGMGGDPGGGTQNGLKPATYHDLESSGALDAFLNQPSSPPMSFVDPLRNYVDPVQGHRLVSDTVGCALGALSTWFYPNPLPAPGDKFSGEGILTPPAPVTPPWELVPIPWPGDAGDARSPANVARREDVHTCLITRLNATGTEVPIFLSGAHVTPRMPPLDAGDELGSYPYFEAVWLASFNPGGQGPALQIHVWPTGEALACIQQNGTTPLIARRVCADPKDPTACGLQMHAGPNDLATYCPSFPSGKSDGLGIYWCTDSAAPPGVYKPAIQTRLGPCAWKALYGDTCALPGDQPPGYPGFCTDPTHP